MCRNEYTVLRMRVSGAMSLFLGSTCEQLKARTGRSKEMSVLKRSAETCVATGLLRSQRIFDAEDAESRFVSQVFNVDRSLCVPRRRFSDWEIWSGMLGEI